MSKAIVTYAAGAHEELLDVALPTYKAFADRHGYDLHVGMNLLPADACGNRLPPAWNKVPLLLDALTVYERVVWFDCDLIVVNPTDDLPPLGNDPARGVFVSNPFLHGLVRHFEDDSEVPNSGVWQVTRECVPLLEKMMELEVFANHGWWEQAALLTLMGYMVPPQDCEFHKIKCRCVRATKWFRGCLFMRLAWNSHPNFRADRPRIVHCSYKSMTRRLEVMRALVRDPTFDYPRYNVGEEKADDDGADEEV